MSIMKKMIKWLKYQLDQSGLLLTSTVAKEKGDHKSQSGNQWNTAEFHWLNHQRDIKAKQ